MELKPGYKQTEVGVIPEDWEIKEINQICKPSNVRINPLTTITNYRCIELEHLSQGTGQLLGFADSNHLKSQKTVFKIGDVLFGKLRPYLKKYYFSEFEGVCTTEIWVLNAGSDVVNRWLYFIVQSDRFLDIANQATGTKMPRAEWSIVGKALIPFPPNKTEQSAIANALSDADALIQSLTRLIAKKRQIKQGAMQTLLNPYENERLKVGWEVKKMPEVCWFQEGPGVRNSQFTRSGVKLLNGTNIDQGELFLDKTDRYISEKEAYGWYSHFLADEGDIIIACSGITVEKFHEKVTVLRKEHLPLCMNTSTMRFKVISKELLHNYLIHFLRSRVFKEQIGGKATGSAQLNFGPSHVNVVEMALPPINEQTRIATILSDMDAEIAALEAKLAKYRHIKQGMMQNLLTGRIRLI